MLLLARCGGHRACTGGRKWLWRTLERLLKKGSDLSAGREPRDSHIGQTGLTSFLEACGARFSVQPRLQPRDGELRQTELFDPYSSRSAEIGSIRVARRAGRKPDSAAMTAIPSVAPIIVAGSCGWIP